MYQKYVKRFLDILLSLLALIIASPLFLILSVWIKLDSKGPVFFRQKRIGIHRTTFEILKFRSMRTDTPRDMATHLLNNPDQWITRAGRFLRKTSLDELPQLINILRGEMSIIGPRPALWNQYDLVELREACGANDVVPGLTGWAQINGRDTISVEEKARLDGEYASKISFSMDLKCLFRTVAVVLKKEGYEEGGGESSSSDQK
ncbi:MAG: sugar transferase [Clostridia bacterium]|nr:sugar transferase [Clostridia bacterium]